MSTTKTSGLLEAGIGWDLNKDGTITYFVRIPDGKGGAKKRSIRDDYGKVLRVEKRTAKTDRQASDLGRMKRDPKSGAGKTENWTYDELAEWVFEAIQEDIDADSDDEEAGYGIGQSHLDGLRSRYNKYVKPYPLAETRLDVIDHDVTTEWAEEIHKLRKTVHNPKGLARRSRKRIHDCVGTITRIGRKEGKWHGIDPFRDISPRLKPTNTAGKTPNIRYALDDGQLILFIEALKHPEFLKRKTNGRVDVACLVAAVFGDRAAGVRGTKVEDVVFQYKKDKNGDWVTVIFFRGAMKGPKATAQHGRTKSGKANMQVVPAWVADRLLDQLAHEQAKGYGRAGDFFFTRDDRTGLPLSKYQLEDAVQAAGKIAGLGHVTPNNLRHTSTDAAGQTDIPLVERAAMHNHSPEVHMKSYNHPTQSVEKMKTNMEKKLSVLGLDMEKGAVMNDEERAYEIRAQVENLLGNLANVMEPEDVLEYVEGLAERMRNEIEEGGS